MNLINKVIFFSLPALLAACVTVSGNYVVTAVDATGKPILGNSTMMATGRGIYTARNAVCSRYPQAVVTIKSQATGEELRGESPHRCK